MIAYAPLGVAPLQGDWKTGMSQHLAPCTGSRVDERRSTANMKDAVRNDATQMRGANHAEARSDLAMPARLTRFPNGVGHQPLIGGKSR